MELPTDATLALLGQVFTTQLLIEGGRYLLAAGTVWLLLHVLLKRRLAHRLIAATQEARSPARRPLAVGWPAARQLRREIVYSLGSLCIYAALGMAIIGGLWQGHIVIYRQPDGYGWLWLLASLPLMLLWQDVYFYWMHRLMHTNAWLRRMHSVHHRSNQPSPWAAYSFHPVEALINGLVVPLALLVVPLHWGVLLLYSLHTILRSALGHAAVETMPRGFARHVLGRHCTTTTHHHLHHESARGNYGLWFTWWDRWCGTERADYHTRFDAVTSPVRVVR